MEVAKVHIHEAEAETVYAKPITTGMVGATVSFELDYAWNNLSVIAVFRAGNRVMDAVFVREGTLIPYELLAIPDVTLYVGLQGVDSESKTVIPTAWTSLGRIKQGANPSGHYSAAPEVANSLWQLILDRLDELMEKMTATDEEVKDMIDDTFGETAEDGSTVPDTYEVATDDEVASMIKDVFGTAAVNE